MKNKTKGAAVKDGSATATDSGAAGRQIESLGASKGKKGDISDATKAKEKKVVAESTPDFEGSPRMGYTQNFGPARQGGYAKGAARVNSIMKGAPQSDVVSGSKIEMNTKGKKLITNVINSPTGGGEGTTTTTYTPPKKTEAGDKAYAALTQEQKDAQDAKYIAKNTKIVNTSSSTPASVDTNVTSNVGSVKTQVDTGLSKLQKNITTAQYTSLLAEDRAIADSITTRAAGQRKFDLAGGGNSFLNQKMLNEAGLSVPISRAGSISDEQVLDVVAGKAADVAREEGNSTKPSQNRYVQNTVAPTGRLYKARTGSSGNTKTHTGYSYEDIMKHSGGYSMNEEGQYVGGGRKKGGSRLKGAARINSIMGGARLFKK